MALTLAAVRDKLVTVVDEHDPNVNQFLQNNKLIPSIHLKRESAPLPSASTTTPVPAEENTKEDYYTKAANIGNHLLQDLKEWYEDVATNTPIYGIPRVVGELSEKYLWPNQQLEESEPKAKRDPIRSMAWHPHRSVIAFADEHDVVYVHEKNENSEGWTRKVLRHPYMKDIKCIEWKRRARGTLAVGCQNGICVWNVGETPVDGNVDSTCMNYLFYPGHEYTSSIAWDPTPGSHLLAVTSGAVSTIVVYDTLSLDVMPLKRNGKGNLLLRWSPNGRWIYVATKNGTSRMWDTLDWTYKELNNPPGLWVQSACWAPDSKSLLLSMHGKSDVHMIYWASASNAAEICHEKVYSTIPSVDSVSGEDRYFSVGDSIKELVLCPDTGRRLAVIFDKSSTIALYAVDVESPLTLKDKSALTKIGNIHGTVIDLSTSPISIEPVNNNQKAVHISLSTRFSTSNTLATLYDNNIVSFTPIML